MDEEDEPIVDWRVFASLTLEESPIHKAGSRAYSYFVTQGPGRETVGFIQPSLTALALSIAMQASERAAAMLPQIKYTSGKGHAGADLAVLNDDTTLLFDFFEQCTITITFSYQALEAYCNWEILHGITEPMNLARGNNEERFTPAELQHKLPLEDKLHFVIPRLYQVGSPKGTTLWRNFRRLSRARDSIAELKSLDQRPNQSNSKIDKESPYYIFMTNRMQFFPKSAIELLLHFEDKDGLIDWLARAKEFAQTYKSLS